MRKTLSALLLIAGSAAFVAYALAAPQTTGYHLVKKVVLGGEGGWDYVNADPTTHRVFISRGTHIMVVDPDGKVVGDAPFNLDPHPSPLIDGIGDAVQSTTRTTNLDTQGTATTIIGPIDGRTAHGCDPVERPLTSCQTVQP